MQYKYLKNILLIHTTAGLKTVHNGAHALQVMLHILLPRHRSSTKAMAHSLIEAQKEVT
jgi:hypothetical protein